ncbi:HDOD domain-containing protein [Rhodoferax sp.]|uniref:HDOD domain-containing protein n=1 Tax=Rhodoferax sp. TaxID=50421 RepID=UPI001ECC7C39|nr:HDOD domain-containing protein [Rhodoferax sp.]MBT9508282.1 HDOD domain-containing protein [Rhodoferax sp.]
MTLEELLASNEALPSIPKIIALLLNELDQAEPDLRKISQLLNTDPVLTTRLLRLANSAQFQFASKISSVSEALALMGLDQVRSLATAAAVTGAFRIVQGIDMNQFWRFSLNTAKLSRMLAGMIRKNQAAAFTAGLIHATGELVMHRVIDKELMSLDQEVPPLALKRASAERKLLGYCYADVGAGFARNWQFPQAIVDALANQNTPFENDVYEPMAGILHLAAWRARAREANYDAQDLTDNFPDTVALALGLDIDMVLQQDPIDWTSRTEVAALV